MKIIRLMVVVAMIVGLNGRAGASFHLWQISEVYSNADGTVQFIELTALAGGQQFVTGHTITSSMGGMHELLHLHVGSPRRQRRQDVPDRHGGPSLASGVTPDYVVPNGFLFTPNGMLNFSEGSDTWS